MHILEDQRYDDSGTKRPNKISEVAYILTSQLTNATRVNCKGWDDLGFSSSASGKPVLGSVVPVRIVIMHCLPQMYLLWCMRFYWSLKKIVSLNRLRNNALLMSHVSHVFCCRSLATKLLRNMGRVLSQCIFLINTWARTRRCWCSSFPSLMRITWLR